MLRPDSRPGAIIVIQEVARKWHRNGTEMHPEMAWYQAIMVVTKAKACGAC